MQNNLRTAYTEMHQAENLMKLKYKCIFFNLGSLVLNLGIGNTNVVRDVCFLCSVR